METPAINCLFIQGFAGTGKTTLAKLLADRWGWVHLECDAMDTKSFADPDEARLVAYERLAGVAAEVASSGAPIIIDAPLCLTLNPEHFRTDLILIPGLSASARMSCRSSYGSMLTGEPEAFAECSERRSVT